jgi:hypothetical protein
VNRRNWIAGAIALACSGGVARAASFVPPAWLPRSERAVLAHDFEHAKPKRVYFISYPKKIAVIFEFDHPVVCGMCHGPAGRKPLAARMIRVSFDRKTHNLSGAPDGFVIRFCEITGNQPPRSRCLRP